jgi:tetratricopeptide (TPR) repeat protein
VVRQVFISHAWADGMSGPLSLKLALEERGMGVWLDSSNIGVFDPIPDAVRNGLAASTLLVAWYTQTYPTRRACREELTLGLLASEKSGQQRVVVINPTQDTGHILEAPLFHYLMADSNDIEGVADAIVAYALQFDEPLGALPALSAVRWWGGAGWAGRTPRFVGRLRELWNLHDMLTRESDLAGPAASGRGTVVVSGMGGVGKSLLAAEYAHLFAPSHSGGVVWLQALGNDIDEQPVGLSMDRAAAAQQAIGAAMGLPIEGLSPSEIRSSIAQFINRVGKPMLWVIDDLPSGLAQSEIDLWRSPAPTVRTIITTRDDRDLSLPSIKLPVFNLAESAQILQPTGGSFLPGLAGVAEQLGGYPLAVTVASDYMNRTRMSPETFSEQIRESAGRFDTLVSNMATTESSLPGDHARQIIATLAASMQALGEPEWDLLRIVVPLAPSLIPLSLVERVFETLTGDPVAWASAVGSEHRDGMWQPLTAGIDVHVMVRRVARELDQNLHRQNLVSSACAEVILAMLNERDGSLHVNDDLAELLLVHGQAMLTRHLSVPARLGAELATVIAKVAYARGRYSAALDSSQRAAVLWEQLLGADSAEALDVRLKVANSLVALGRAREAVQIELAVYETRKRLLGIDHPDTLTAQHNYAATLVALGDLKRALENQQAVVAARIKVLGPYDYETLRSKGNVATILSELDRPHESIALEYEVLEGFTRTLGDTHTDTVTAKQNLGVGLFLLGKVEESVELLRTALAARENEFGSAHPFTLLARLNLAEGLLALPDVDVDVALDLQSSVLEARTQMFGPEHPDVLIAKLSVSDSHESRNDHARAYELRNEVVNDMIRVLGHQHPDTSFARSKLADSLERLGDSDGAEAVRSELRKHSGEALYEE